MFLTFIAFPSRTASAGFPPEYALRGVFREMERQCFPEEVVDAIRDSADSNLYFFGDKVPLSAMYCVPVASIRIPVGASSEMKEIHSRPQAFHMAKPYFTREAHFTNPARDLFR